LYRLEAEGAETTRLAHRRPEVRLAPETTAIGRSRHFEARGEWRECPSPCRQRVPTDPPNPRQLPESPAQLLNGKDWGYSKRYTSDLVQISQN